MARRKTKKSSSSKHAPPVHSEKQPAVMSDSKVSEEAALTARLFGGNVPSSSASAAAWLDDDEGTPGLSTDESHANEGDGWGGDLFAIDRSGEDVEANGDDGERRLDDDHDQMSGGSGDGESSTESVMMAADGTSKASMNGAAWKDLDEESSDADSEDEDSADRTKKQKRVSLVDGPNRLKKLRKYRDETAPVSVSEYEIRPRERFVNTASVAARTDWADVSKLQQQEQDVEKKGGRASSYEESYVGDDAAQEILQSNASLFDTSSHGQPLPPTLLNIVRTRDANLADPNNSVVNSLQFHPGSDDDNLLLMTAGMDKMLRFFRVDGESNPKVHGIHFPQMPIMCASFLGDTGSVVLSGRRPFFYVYDAVSGKIQKIPGVTGRAERSLEKFSVSPDGRYIAFIGNDGYIILVDGTSYQWLTDLKMNGSVRAVTFTQDSEYILGSGSDGDVYRWHIGSRRCVERFRNQDGTITSSLAVSDKFLAVGAESGVVNLYNDQVSSSRESGGLALAVTERDPLKSIMNMTTSADYLKFNNDGQILAMSTRRETNGLKLLHVPTKTVFSNWPTSKTPLKYVWGLDFSPSSKYLAVGNDHGKCLLYKLRHYWDE